MKSIGFIIFCLEFALLISCEAHGPQSDARQTNIVWQDSSGHTLTVQDLANVTGNVNYEIMSNKTIAPAAISLHREARELGQAGNYDLSISKLEQAIAIQPDWAYPPYDLAFTYLLKGDSENALKYYKMTDELEPKGFFTAKTALYSLEGEKSGIFPKGVYLALMQIEWTDDPNGKLEIAQMLTQNVPNYAPAWKALANLLTDKAERQKAIEKGLSENPDAETKGILIINKAILLDDGGRNEEAKEILGTLIFSPDVTTSNIELAKFALKNLTENHH